MSRDTQILNQLKKLTKAVSEPITQAKKKAKKMKFKDLFKQDNLARKINNWLDNLSVDDAINFTAFIFAVFLIYPIVYKMKPQTWWGARLLRKEPFWSPYHWTTRIFVMFGESITEEEKLKLDFNCLAIAVLTSYAVIYQGKTIKSYAQSLITALSIAM